VYRPDPQHDGNYEAYVASNVQYQASTDPAYQALLSQRQQLQDPDAEAAMVSPAKFPKLTAGQCALVHMCHLMHGFFELSWHAIQQGRLLMGSLCLVCGTICAQHHVTHKSLVMCIVESAQVLHKAPSRRDALHPASEWLAVVKMTTGTLPGQAACRC